MKKRKIDYVALELRRIAKQNGGLLKPEVVVSAAEPISSPLHPKFEWDDNAAAHAYRLWQARMLIRVCVEKLTGVSVPTEVFVSLSTDRYEGGGYRVTTEVLRSEEMRAQLLQDALDELEIFKLKFKRLNELTVVFKAIQKVTRHKAR